MNEFPVDEKSKVDALKFPLDPIHGGLRFAVFGSFLGAGALGYAASLLLIPNPGVMPFIVAGIAAAGTSTGIERTLKDRWTSGRELVADSDRIAIAKHGKIETVVDPQLQVNVLTWRFEIKKEGPRAKKGWWLLAMALRQNDNYVVMYSTASPEDYEDMPITGAFTKLEKKGQSQSTTLSSPGGMKKAGEQKRLHDAEVARQIIGGDMQFEDFVATIEFFQQQYPRWMIKG